MDFNIVDFNIVDFVNSTNQLCINENEKKNDLRKMKKKKKWRTGKVFCRRNW